MTNNKFCVDNKIKRKFIIIGSGWRSLYYVRIAKALPEHFELCAMLCRTQDKAQRIHEEYDIHTTTSVSECEQYNPDFVVVAVNKTSIYQVSCEWMQKGYVVLCETPAALDMENLIQLWNFNKKTGRLCVAEQYLQYPVYQSIVNLLNQNLIGERWNTTMSIAHDYHGASLIREVLGIKNERFKVYGNRYVYPVIETASRYEKFYDGRIVEKSRDRCTFEFENGKIAFYDFNSVQYRSEIRSNYINVHGLCGELKDKKVSYLDDKFIPHKESLEIDSRKVHRDLGNPNLDDIEEIVQVKFEGKVLYKPPFGKCGLSQDETAIAVMMESAAQYNNGGKLVYSLENALTDAYMSISMQRAISNPQMIISSEMQPWQN